MEATLTPEAPTEIHIVEGSNGMLIEVDGQILPNYDATIVPFEEGDVVTGKVVRIDKDEVLVDIGYKSEGVIPNNELSIRKSVDPSEEVELGEEVDALVLTKEDQDGRLILSKKRARFERAWRRIEGAAESGEPVTGSVIEVVKGGLIVDLGVRGFLPASLVDIRRVPNLDEYLGQNIETKVIELNRSRNNVVLSRRAVLEEERKEQRQAILERLQPGLVIEGQISNIVDFGAFVDLDGIDGLIHISELSWSHVNHPSEILSIGDTVQVKVLDIDRDRQRISLGLKQTQEDPWQRVVDTYNVGDELEGKVTKVVAFGAFVEILEGVEGLVHISELAQHHVENPREIIQPGDDVKVKILEIDSERRRLSLSIKRVEGQVLPQRDSLRRRRRPTVAPATSRTCPSSGSPRTSSPPRPRTRRSPRPPSRPTRRSPPRPTRPSRPSKKPTRALSRPSPPFVGLTGGIGAGQVGGARRARAPRRGDAVHRRGGARALRVEARCATPCRALGHRTDRRREIARGSAFAVAGGADVARGAAVAEGRRAHLGRGARSRRPRDAGAAGARRRGPAAVRIGDGRGVRRYRGSGGRRAGPARARRGRGHAALDERTARQLTQEEKAARATYTVANSGTIEELQQTLAGVLEKLKQS